MKNILIVDDSESIREIVSHILINEGFNVIKSIDGLEAYEKLLEMKNVDLIITDLHMPNLDGIGFIRKVREHEEFKQLPIILLTTETQVKKTNEAKDAGATGWIIKPFVPNKLLIAVRKLIR